MVGVLFMSLLGGCASKGERAGVVLDSVTLAGREHAYAVYVPRGYAGMSERRAVLFLHGRGESGTNGTRQLVVGLPEHLLWDSAEWPCVVVMPQKPDGDSQWEDHAEMVFAVLDRAVREYGVDERKIVLTGLSQGGHGCWSINGLAPERFAAVAPVCGYAMAPVAVEGGRVWPFEPESAEVRAMVAAAVDKPVWIFHGGADPVVPAEQSEWMARLLREAGAKDVRLTVFEGVGHDAWDRAYSDPELRAWLLGAGR